MRFRSLSWFAIPAGALALAGAYIALQLPEGARAERILRRVIHETRPATAALYGYSYAPRTTLRQEATRNIANAAYYARETDDSNVRRRLMATVAIVRGDYDNARIQLQDLEIEHPDDVGIVNDLGVVLLETSDQDIVRAIDALRLFRRAARIDPESVAISHNVALAYLRLGAPGTARRWIDSLAIPYSQSPWSNELESEMTASGPTKLASIDLETFSFDSMNEQLPAWWRRVVDVGLRQPEVLDWTPALDGAIAAYEKAFGDLTPRAILAPLSDERASDVIDIRTTIANLSDAPDRIIDILDGLSPIVSELPPDDFDRLRWSTVRAENIQRNQRTAENAARAFSDLEKYVDSAREIGFVWLYGHGLEAIGGDLAVASLPRLTEANTRALDTLSAIGARADAGRAMSQLLAITLLEGEWGQSLDIGLETLGLTPEDDHQRRMIVLDLLTENPLVPGPIREEFLRTGMAHADHLGPAAKAYVMAQAAKLASEEGNMDLARSYLDQVKAIERTVPLIPATFTRIAIAEARLLGARDLSREAEDLFDQEIANFENRGLDTFVSPIYLERAEWLHRQGRTDDAGRAYEDALRVIENSDDASRERLPFDAERRRGYESAIEFHLEDDVLDAWRHVQRYRSKLDVSILPQFGQAVPVDESGGAGIEVPVLEDRTLVEYTLLEDRILIWIIDEGRLSLEIVNADRSELTSEVERFVYYLIRGQDPGRLDRMSRNLYDALVAPWKEQITRGRTVVIVPDRILHRLPFAALLSPEGRFLIQDFPVVESPTLSRAILSPEALAAEPTLVGIGSNQTVSMRREVDAVRRLHPSLDVLDSASMEPDAVIDAVRGASLLHVTGHSAVDTGGLSSAILLDGVAGGRRITTDQVAGLGLAPGALVVLSSCDSSVGNSIGGTGVRGLTSAFLAAGAGAVVGSLWQVDDQATASLMTTFHERLSAGATIAESLRDAQLDFIEAGRPPYEWSAFAVTGDGTATSSLPFLVEGVANR